MNQESRKIHFTIIAWFLTMFLVFGLSVFFHIPNAHAVGINYYVSATGSDSSPGTQSQPWKTVSKVNNAPLNPGDTVLFNRGGAWNEQLVPKSGTGESTRITYGAYGTGNKPKLTSFQAIGKSYITVTDLEFNTGSSNAVLLSNSHHITLQNCTIYSSNTSWGPALQLTSNAHHNRILNCNITLDVYSLNDAVNLRTNADYNLFEGNTITTNGGHGAVSVEGATGGGVANYNIFRNNLIISTTTGGGTGIQFAANSDWNVIENNVITGGGANNTARHEVTFKLVTRNNIVRNNILKDNRMVDAQGLEMEIYEYGGITNSAENNRVYNNIITNILPGATALTIRRSNGTGYGQNNIFKNNAVYNNGGTNYQTDVDGSFPVNTKNVQLGVSADSNIRNNYFFNNLFYKSDDNNILWVNNQIASVNTIQTANPGFYQGNLQLDPKLDSSFKPVSGSPVIDAGSFLTTITSPSGFGSTLVVADAKYFFDGYGIVSGDTIQIGSQTAVITTINYSTNTLTLDRSISWTQNQGVSLPYNGSKPDIGVYEYGGVTTPTPTPTASPIGSASPAPSPSTTLTPTPSPSSGPLACDLNKDSKTDILDFQSLVNVILGVTPNPGGYDVNKDSQVNVFDAQTLANVILGKSNCP